MEDGFSPGLARHLDFEDVTFTLPPAPLPATTTPIGLEGIGENPSIKEIQRDARRIRENLARLDGMSRFKVESEQEVPSLKEVKNLFSTLKSEYLERAAKEELFKFFSESGDKYEESFELLSDDEPDIETVRSELAKLKLSNAVTIQEIETLISTVASDMNSFEKNLTSATTCLDDTENAHDEGSALIQHSESPQDLEDTIYRLEEQLRQNESDYRKTEALMKGRIEQYNLEMEELRAQARQLDEEEESLRMLVNVSGRCLNSQNLLESLSDVSVIAVGDDFIHVQLITEIPTLYDPVEAVCGQEMKGDVRHKLHIRVKPKSMEIEAAELMPADVPIDDLVTSAQQTSDSDKFSGPIKDCENAEFGRQFAFLVREVHRRISASFSSASNDPRF